MARLKDRGEKKKSGYTNRPKVAFYQSHAWKQAKRIAFARDNHCKYCRRTLGVGKTLDHFRPLRFWPEMAVNQKNLYPSCRSCHSRKSARESQVHTAREWERIVLPKYRIHDRMSFLNGKKGDTPP